MSHSMKMPIPGKSLPDSWKPVINPIDSQYMANLRYPAKNENSELGNVDNPIAKD